MKTTTGHCSIMDSNLCTGKVSSLTPHTKPVWLCSSHIYQTWMNMNKLLQSLMFLWQQLRWVQVGSNMLEIRMSNDRWKIGVTMTTMTVRSPQGQPVPEELQLWQLRLKPSFEVFHNVWFSMCFHWGTNRHHWLLEIWDCLWLSWNSAIMSARSLPINVLGVLKVTVSEVFFPSIIGNQRLSSNVQPTGLCPAMHIRKSFAVARNLEVFFRGCRCKAKWSDNGFVWRWGTSKSIGESVHHHSPSWNMAKLGRIPYFHQFSLFSDTKI